MTLQTYAVVELLTNRYQDRGVGLGAIGTILEVYENGDCEVEFSRPDGTTIAWFAVAPTEVKLWVDENVISIISQRESA